MLDHFVQYVGSSPYGAPAVLCAIAHMQTADGVWYPMGGTRAVAEALVKLAGELGVDVPSRHGCDQIAIENGAVTGLVTASGDDRPTIGVISNMDSVRTYRELVGGEVGQHFARKDLEPACSGVVLYLGLNKRYDHLAPPRFRLLARSGGGVRLHLSAAASPRPIPTCYIAAPSGTDPSVAPEGGEALYVLVHTPYLRPHHDWTTDVPGLPPRHPGQAEAHRAACRISRSAS